MSGVATIAPMVVGAVLAKTGIKFDADKIVNSLPGHVKIGDMVIQNAIDTMMLTNIARSSILSYSFRVIRAIKRVIRT